MSIPVWQPATTYVPGALVVPRSSAPPTVAALLNPNFTDATGWDLEAPLAILTDGLGYGGDGRVYLPSTSNGAVALNQAHIGPLVAGQTVSAQCMIRHATAADSHSSDGACRIHWYKADGTALPPIQGSGLPSLSSSDYQAVTVSGQAPAGASYCRIGVGLNRHSTDVIEATHFTLSYTPQTPARAVMYEATQPAPGKSAATEPVWPPLGSSVVDNEVTWNGVNIDRLVWQASPLLTSGATEPVWPTAVGAAVHDGTIDWIANSPVITDPNCPNSKIVTMAANKIFAGDGDIVRYCATNNATDWSSEQDAGYLPTGLKAIGETQCTALAIYRANLAMWTASSQQVWQVDPDPANMAFIDAVMGGTAEPHTQQPMANDLYFLSGLGVRSVGITATTGTMGGTDVGSPVDPPVRAAIAAYNALVAAGTPPAWSPLAVDYPNASQYWLILGAEAYVYALSTVSKVSAWQHYTFPFTITGAAVLDGQLYARSSANDLYVLDETLFADDGVNYDVQAQTPWLDFGSPGVQKLFIGVDAVIAQGVAGANTFASVGWDENNPASLTPEIAFGEDTQPGTVLPIPCSGPALSIRLRNASADSWELAAITAYYNRMRVTS